ncbi:hypothetical protein [Frankia sp. AgB32]|uniref:hypothetical protein n=1 Tax=Frankia sp. AgB32 TaxID=631119 RepID=UPI00200BB2D2|nr:hypothetical protein [Frankia sp. AgB32]MCK9896502.1 hypothetical protein [Frankia sp. AgB32]
MEHDQPATLTSGLSGAGSLEAPVGATDVAQAADSADEQPSFGPVANPKRLRLGVSRSL